MTRCIHSDFVLANAVAAAERVIDAHEKITLSAQDWDIFHDALTLARRLPHYPVPAAVLGRLAVDRGRQGRGLGEMLLLDAIRRVVRASATFAKYAIIVDAQNERAQAFYGRYGFRAVAGAPRRLFLPLETFGKLGL